MKKRKLTLWLLILSLLFACLPLSALAEEEAPEVVAEEVTETVPEEAPTAEEESSEDEQAVENTAAFQSRARVLDLLADLDELDAKLLSLRFGLEGGRPLSQQEAAKILGMTQAEAGQREMAALARLRSK